MELDKHHVQLLDQLRHKLHAILVADLEPADYIFSVVPPHILTSFLEYACVIRMEHINTPLRCLNSVVAVDLGMNLSTILRCQEASAFFECLVAPPVCS